MRIRKIVLFVFYFVILTIISACESAPLPDTSESTMWDSEFLHIEPECSPSSSSSLFYNCEFLVTAGPFDVDRTVDVKFHADYGINFSQDVHFENILSASDHTSVVENVHLQPQETQVIHFPFTYDLQTALAGEYMVVVQLIEKREGADLIVDEIKVNVFIHDDYRDEHNDIGLMQGRSDFDAEYAQDYVTGKHASYRVLLDSDEHPTTGSVFIRVNASHDNYDPVLIIHSGGGVEFEIINDVFICADTGGSRIVRFPFRIIEGVHQPNGRYVFSLSILEDGVTSVHEILSTAVILHTEDNINQTRWLETVSITSSPVATPAASHIVGIGGLNNTKSGNSSTGYSQTVSTGNPNEGQIFSNGGRPLHCDLSTNSTPAPNKTKPDQDIRLVSSILGGDPLTGNDPNAGGSSGGMNDSDTNTPDRPVRAKSDDPSCINWKYQLNEDELDLMDIYLNYVSGKVDINLEDFANSFWICNNITENSIVLPANTTYYLPDESHP